MTDTAYKPQGYTEADQRADAAFLTGVHYGRETERARMLVEGYVIPSEMGDH